jgi:hypothetical protein
MNEWLQRIYSKLCGLCNAAPKPATVIRGAITEEDIFTFEDMGVPAGAKVHGFITQLSSGQSAGVYLAWSISTAGYQEFLAPSGTYFASSLEFIEAVNVNSGTIYVTVFYTI